MASLADKAILSGADNRPSMLEKDMYDSWKSRMELYMLNHPHGRMILESVKQSPLIWPSVEVEGVTRLKKYSFYLRFSLLLNDMNMYNMKLEQFQLVRDLHTTNVDQLHAYVGQHEYHANEVRLLNGRTLDPLALISQHQLNRTPYQHYQPLYQQSQFQPQATSYQSSPHATTYHNSQFVSSGPSSLTHLISYPRTNTSSLVNHNAYMASSSALQIAYALMDQQSSEYSPPKAGLVVPVFQKRDDPIDAINHMMSFLTFVVASRYPAINNQLRTSSNPRQQATINNRRVTIQPIQGRQNFVLAGTDTSSLVNHNAYMASSSDPRIAYPQLDQQSSEYSPPEAGLVEEHKANRGLSRVITAKANVTCPSSA
nr:hypothetical protein [Tanacetum cinerariifolium]